MTSVYKAPKPEDFSSHKDFCLADTHALVSLLQNLNKANYNLPIMVTDSGKPPMTNITDLRVQVCSCKNSKVDCNGAGTLHLSLSLLLLFSLLSLLSGKSAWLQHTCVCTRELHHMAPDSPYVFPRKSVCHIFSRCPCKRSHVKLFQPMFKGIWVLFCQPKERLKEALLLCKPGNKQNFLSMTLLELNAPKLANWSTMVTSYSHPALDAKCPAQAHAFEHLVPSCC